MQWGQQRPLVSWLCRSGARQTGVLGLRRLQRGSSDAVRVKSVAPTIWLAYHAGMTEPTERDRKNAEFRQAVADRQQAEYADAMRMALAVLGPGFQPWMKVSVVDSDYRRTGDDTPRAVVYKLYSGEQRLSEYAVYIRQMPDGTVKKAYGYRSLIEELLEEPHPTRTVEFRGRRVPVARYELHWSALELYHPRDADQLAALRISREQKKAARAEATHRSDNPLFTTRAERNRDEGQAR
jgi:hypothetical protein